MIRVTYVCIFALLAFAMPTPESMAAQNDAAAAQESVQGQGKRQGQFRQGKNNAVKREGQGGYGRRSGPRDGSGPDNGPKDGTGPYHDADNPRWK